MEVCGLQISAAGPKLISNKVSLYAAPLGIHYQYCFIAHGTTFLSRKNMNMSYQYVFRLVFSVISYLLMISNNVANIIYTQVVTFIAIWIMCKYFYSCL